MIDCRARGDFMNALATPAAVATNPPRAAYRPPTREDILTQCIAADAQWTERPGRNLVLLFDGTGNILGNQQDTNVVKLLRMLGKGHDPSGKEPTQLVYYDPGVGTTNAIPAAGTKGREKFEEDVINNSPRGRTPLVHCVGVSDTVEAIGLGGLGSIKISNSTDFDRKRFAHVRHAMSLYESRSKYTPRRYEDPHFTAEEQPWR